MSVSFSIVSWLLIVFLFSFSESLLWLFSIELIFSFGLIISISLIILSIILFFKISLSLLGIVSSSLMVWILSFSFFSLWRNFSVSFFSFSIFGTLSIISTLFSKIFSIFSRITLFSFFSLLVFIVLSDFLSEFWKLFWIFSLFSSLSSIIILSTNFSFLLFNSFASSLFVFIVLIDSVGFSISILIL